MDLTLSTLVAAGVPLPEGRALDGIDLIPILSGEAPVVERTLHWRFGPQRAVRRGPWKYLALGRNELLFNLTDDVGERRDLSAQRPELVSYRSAARLGSRSYSAAMKPDDRVSLRQPETSSKYPPAKPGALVVAQTGRGHCAPLGPPYGWLFSSNRSCSCRRSSCSCARIYARIARSSRPSLDTK